MFSGILTSLVTPFRDGDVDDERFAAFVDWQIAEGAEGLVTCDIAGEGSTLSPAERYRLIRIAVDVAAGRVPVIAATGTNATSTSIELTRAARTAGASGAMLVTPYYNKPSQEGIFRHVEAVARAVDLPLILDNAPHRTNVEILPATLARLAALPSVVGLLDQASDPVRLLENSEACGKRLVRFAPEECAPFHERAPAAACLSIAANIAPGLCRAIWEERLSGRANAAVRLDALHRALRREPEPVAAKYAVSLLWPAFDPKPRLPLTDVRDDTAAAIRVALAGLCSALDATVELEGHVP